MNNNTLKYKFCITCRRSIKYSQIRIYMCLGVTTCIFSLLPTCRYLSCRFYVRVRPSKFQSALRRNIYPSRGSPVPGYHPWKLISITFVLFSGAQLVSLFLSDSTCCLLVSKTMTRRLLKKEITYSFAKNEETKHTSPVRLTSTNNVISSLISMTGVTG